MAAAVEAPPAGPFVDDKPEEETTATKLFELRAITIDETQPNILKLSFGGSIELTRTEAEWVDFFNKLADGKVATLKLGVFVAGSKKTYRRDGEGNVDAIVQTKSVKITDVHLDQE